MESLMMVLIGVLVAVATYLILSKVVLKVIIGTAILSHAVHLLILTVGGLKRGDVHWESLEANPCNSVED